MYTILNQDYINYNSLNTMNNNNKKLCKDLCKVSIFLSCFCIFYLIFFIDLINKELNMNNTINLI